MKKTVGILLVGWYQIVAGTVLLIILSDAVRKMIQMQEYHDTLLYAFILFISLACFLLGIGVLRLNNFARKAVIATSCINFFIWLPIACTGRAPMDKFRAGVLTFIPLLLIFYLIRPQVKENFK